MRTLKISLLVFILSINISSQNFWQQTNGPFGGATVNDFLSYNDSILFLATNEGIIKSSDQGVGWNRITGQYQNRIISCIEKDSLGVLYAGTKDFYNNMLLLKSIDQGNSWTSVSGASSKDIVTILIPYKDTIFIGSSDMGIYRTFDHGITWSQANNGIEYDNITEIILLENENLLAGSIGGGVYKSSNWGDSWIASNTGLPPYSQGYINAESFCETEPGHIFVGTLWYIYYSTNYGETWTYKSNGLVERTAKCIVNDQNGFLYAGMDLGNGIFISTNYGNNWSHFGLNNTVYTLGWDSNSRLNAGVTSNGLYRLNEDSSWTQVYNQGYTPLEVNDLCLTNSGNLLASTQWWGLHYTSNGGELWTRTNYQGNEPNALETIDDSIFIVGGNSHAYVSKDTGKSWSATGNFAAWSLFYDDLNLIEYLGTENIVNYVCGIYTTTDFGQNWELLYEFPPLNPNRRINALLITKTNQAILTSVSYWVPWPGNSGFNRLYRSNDNGQSWVIVYESVNNAVTQLMEDATSNLYALAQDELLISEDEGNTWINRNIPSSDCLAADYSGRIYRNDGIGIQYSADKGITWIAVDNSGLNNWVNDIVINQNNRIYIATTSGVYIGEADSIVLTTEKSEPIKTFYLSQNYPNPFNPSTSMQYTIGSRQFVSLKVFDLLGREVETLVNEEKPAGEYEAEFNGNNLPSGIYFYQLKAGELIETRKMVLIK